MPVYPKPVTIPANTPETTPVTETITVEERLVTEISVYFPPGCAGLARLRVYYGEEQIAPKPAGSYFLGHDSFVRSPLNWRTPEWPCTLTVKAWNIDDTYQHTPIVFVTTLEEEAEPPWSLLRDFISILKKLILGG